MNENGSVSMENYCQYCLTPWKYGNFLLKTHSKHQNKISKLPKKHPSRTFLFTTVNIIKLNNNLFLNHFFF